MRICPALREATEFATDAVDRPCCNSGDLPPLSRQTWNYLANTAAWLRGGARTVSSEDFARRKAICEACPSGMLRSTDRGPRCGACGCWIDRKAARLVHTAESDCPLGHWPIVDNHVLSAADEPSETKT